MYASQTRFGLGDPAWLDPTIAGSIFLFSLVVALLFNRAIFPLILRFTQWTPSDLDSRMVTSLKLPLTLGVIVLGAFLAFSVPLDLNPRQQGAVDTVGSLLVIVLGVVGIGSVLSNVFAWYGEAATRGNATALTRLLPLFRRIAVGSIYGLGGLLILDQLNVNISPLIAGLGLGGLAVALAIQPTLANLFAGTYVMTEGVISPGDYIEMENRIAGYVVNVGWRSVRMRTWGNNLVVIPNSKFAETIITNYQGPVPAVNVYLTCGVSYDSDLYTVEQVSTEVMNDVLDTVPEAEKSYGAYFGYDNFGDSNIEFWLFLQAKDRLASFVVRTELIKRLHARFRQEGIVINYPVRTLQLPKEWTPQAPMEANEAAPQTDFGGGDGPAAPTPPRQVRRATDAGNPQDPPGEGREGPG